MALTIIPYIHLLYKDILILFGWVLSLAEKKPGGRVKMTIPDVKWLFWKCPKIHRTNLGQCVAYSERPGGTKRVFKAVEFSDFQWYIPVTKYSTVPTYTYCTV